ncbi:MAG: MFS transporter [Chloroflexi bacterium]|nr:MFS transporter [Chloroflexota bacterium]
MLRRTSAHPRSLVEQNAHHLTVEIFWFGLAVAATSRFLSMYAIRLEASPLAQGLMVALPGLVLGLSTMLAQWWRNRYPSSVNAMALPGMGFRLIFLLPLFTPFFPAEWQVPYLLVAVTLPAVAQGIAGAIFLTFMRESIGDDRWDRLNSRRMTWFNVGVAIGAVAFGALLSKLPFPINYQVMFGTAFLLSIVSQWYVMHTRPIYVTPAAVPAANGKALRVIDLPGFRSVIITMLIAFLTFLSINAMVPLFLVNRLGGDETFIAFFGLVELAGGALMGMMGDRLVHKFGARRTASITLGLTALAPIIIVFGGSLPLALIAGFLTGLGWTGTSLSLLRMLMEKVPTYAMPKASAVYQQVVAIGSFIGPLTGSVLVNGGVDIGLVLVLGAALRFGGALAIRFDLTGARRTRLDAPQPHPIEAAAPASAGGD